ncbi:sugar phosphate isomerase/epimerase family protein [Compostibacter hankyongensis]
MTTEASFYSRRRMLKQSASLFGLAAFGPMLNMFSVPERPGYRIGVCDWSIGKGGDITALTFAQKLGLDGVMVSLGSVKDNMHLRQKEVQEAYLSASRKSGVQISSLAIGEMNNVPYKSSPLAEEWVKDSIDVAKALGCKVILLAFFNNGDLRGDEAGIKEVIRRLKKVAPKAEKAGVILGIESWLSAKEHLKIIEAIGSPNVRVYFDVANSHQMGHDIYSEMALLGTKYICEVHLKENGALLGKGVIDFKRVKKVLDHIGYQGWVIMEGGIPPGATVADAYASNTAYIRSVFSL